MSATFCAPVVDRTKEQLSNLRKLFDGERTVDVDGKPHFIGDKISKHYLTTKDSFGNKMFEEIVWRSTYKPAIDTYDGFTDGDFRRIRNEILKESKRLNNKIASLIDCMYNCFMYNLNKSLIKN